MAKQFINPPELSDVQARGFAYAVKVGNTVYVAGQVARAKDGSVVGPGDLAAQVDRVFENIQIILAAAGATFADVVKMNTYLTDQAAFAQLRDLRRRWTGDHTPASTAVVVTSLSHPDFLIEVEVIAEID